MKHLFFSLLFLLIASSQGQAQSPEFKPAGSTFYLQTGLPFIANSLNFEQLVVRKKTYWLGLGVELPFYAPFAMRNFGSSLIWSPGVGGRISNNIGPDPHFWELSVGYSFFNNSPELGRCRVVSLFTGYRYQRPDGGFFFRSGLGYYGTASHPEAYNFPSISVSAGYTIPNGSPRKFSPARQARREADAPYKSFSLTVSSSLGIGRLHQETIGIPRNGPLPYNTALLTSRHRLFSTFGLGFKRPFKKNWSLALEFQYRRMGFEYDFYRINQGLNGDVEFEGDLEYSLHQLNIPFYVDLQVLEKPHLHLFAGPDLTYVLGYERSGNYLVNEQEEPLSQFPKRPENRFLGLSGGFGWEFPIGSQQFDLQYRAGTSSGYVFTGPLARQGWMQLRLAYHIPLVSPKAHL